MNIETYSSNQTPQEAMSGNLRNRCDTELIDTQMSDQKPLYSVAHPLDFGCRNMRIAICEK